MDSGIDSSRSLSPPTGSGLQHVLEALPVGVAVFAPDRRCRWFNATAAGMTLGLVEEALTRDLVDLIRARQGDEAAVRIASALTACLAGQSPQRLSYWPLARADGTGERWFDLDFMRIDLDPGFGVALTVTEVTPHVRAQRALADSEVRWRALAEGVPQLVWSARVDGAVTYVNQQWRSYTGRSAPDLIAEGWTEALHPLDRERVIGDWRGAVADGRAWQAEYRLRRADGEYRWFLARAWPHREASGRVAQWFGASTDIHDRKLADEALRASEHRLRWLVDNTTESIWRFELDQPIAVELDEDEQIAAWIRHGRFAECNQAMAFAHGLASPADIVGLRLEDLLGLDQEGNRDFLRAFIRSGYRLVDAEIVVHDRDGRPRHLLNNLMAQVVDGQAVRGWGSSRDITAYRASEAAVREAEERVRLAISAADVGTWDYDPASGGMTWSERLAGMFAIDAGERPGMDAFVARIHGDDRERVRRLVMHAVSQGSTGAFDTEFRVLAPQGVRWLAGKGRTTFAHDGAPLRFLGAVSDISERKLAEEQLARKACELERSNAELEQFAYVASHDLQEPLRMITSYLQLLQKRYRTLFDATAGEYFGYVVSGAERMRAMIKAVLEYSRVGRREGSIVELDATKALRDALDNLRTKVAASGATMVVEPMPRVRADPVRLTQVFQNLVGNAIKFRRPEVAPLVRIEASERECEWVFTVADNGIGIDPEAHGRVFMLFQRLNTVDEYPGSGIGLATCKKVVERMGGRIWIDSRPGSGSAFHFSLPK